MKIKKRLDVLLTEQMYADTRSKAQAIIIAGQVYVNG
jgi:predicted rRNA methylase YqxC with S4 and FtsJ domains